MIIRLQKAEQKMDEVKHLVANEGKEEVSRKRYALKNKLVISGLADGETMWEET
ncbi:MAG: hypothetical protein HPY70_12035 [Firmicutes bacterium]|nr:hypothetical protein [Bacillota bacterium]